MSDLDPPTVLIGGAGPAGLIAACERLSHGVKPRIVERRLPPHREARGTALQPAMLASLERAGLIERFRRAGARIRRIQLLGPSMRVIAREDFAEADVLDGLRVTLETGGRSEAVTMAYVLGAGDDHGATRHSMQEHLGGQTYDGLYWVADANAGHHLIEVGEAPGLDLVRARWGNLVSIVDASSAGFDAAEAGVAHGGAVLVRPDGFIGLHAAPADEATMAALDVHLATCLVPNVDTAVTVGRQQ